MCSFRDFPRLFYCHLIATPQYATEYKHKKHVHIIQMEFDQTGRRASKQILSYQSFEDIYIYLPTVKNYTFENCIQL